MSRHAAHLRVTSKRLLHILGHVHAVLLHTACLLLLSLCKVDLRLRRLIHLTPAPVLGGLLLWAPVLLSGACGLQRGLASRPCGLLLGAAGFARLAGIAA